MAEDNWGIEDFEFAQERAREDYVNEDPPEDFIEDDLPDNDEQDEEFFEKKPLELELSIYRKLKNWKIHELKCVTDIFEVKWRDDKPWEIRFNDRNFQVGDLILEREINKDGTYTGRRILEQIRYILHGGQYGIEPGYCIMSVLETNRDIIKEK